MLLCSLFFESIMQRNIFVEITDVLILEKEIRIIT